MEHMDNREFALRMRRIILERSFKAHVGHVGSALSIVEIVAAVYTGLLRVSDPDDPERDRFILSKGHAALALYAALHLTGRISEDQLGTFLSDATYLGVHPEKAVSGIDFCTGSLGQGLSYGAGAALAARYQRSPRRVFVVVSDAECNEGSIWESVMFAAHHLLSNLIVIVDANGQQALGYTDQVLRLSPLAHHWRSFGWDVHEVDGHNIEEMLYVAGTLDTVSGPPHVLVARTTFGKGVSFMESKIKWHYWPMSADDYRKALQDIERAS